jgi:hypothetical protein
MTRLVAGVLVIALAGCEVDEPAVFPESTASDPAVTFSLRTEGRSVVVRVGENDLLSADVNVARYPTEAGASLRGVAFGRAVNLDTAAGAVAGLAGGEPLNLVVEREGRAIRLHGLVRGRLSSFRIGPGEAAGTLGACAYALARDGDRYEGRRSCGGGRTERAELRLADSLARWSDPDRAAALALLMGAR